MQCPTLGVQSFIRNGVRASLIPIVASFFEGRHMRVKWRGQLSSLRYLPGSGPQGSTFGVLEYLSQSNDNSDNVPVDDRYKFMDDLTLLEFIQLMEVGLASCNIKAQVPSNIPQHNQIIRSEHLKTTNYVKEINEWTEKNLMKLNEKKTKQIIFNFNKGKQFTTQVKLKGEPLEVVDEVKLLGVIITKDLKWEKNTKYLVKKANKKMRMLHIASKFTRNREHLKQIYKTFIRCNLEFSSNVWHSSLTQENREDLERVQKAALKVILKKDYTNYKDSLKLANLESLEKRRETMGLRFAKTCLNNQNFSKLFPLNSQRHVMKVRNPLKYLINKANTERYKCSSIPYMQRLLNDENRKRKREANDLTKELNRSKKSMMLFLGSSLYILMPPTI